jgi:hypothetical protein
MILPIFLLKDLKKYAYPSFFVIALEAALTHNIGAKNGGHFTFEFLCGHQIHLENTKAPERM